MSRNLLYIVVAACLLMVACKPSVPSRYIQPDDMEDLLCDLHIAQAMAGENGKTAEERDYLTTLYFAATLEKHGVTKAEFDTSLTYYYIRADRFTDIYRHVAQRLSDKAMDLGASEGEVNRYANLSGSGDTIDVWTGNLSALLIPYPPYNIYSFEQKADTSFRKGDAFMLIMQTDFIYQSGQRNGEICLTMRYDNDSVVSRTTGFSSSGVNQLRMLPNGNHLVKEIRGYIYLAPEKEPTTQLKLLFLNGVQLIKFRKQRPADQESTDSVTVTAVEESLER